MKLTFKRIAKDPVPPSQFPSREKIAKMDAADAYEAGREAGKKLNAARSLNGTVFYKESDSGVGFKRWGILITPGPRSTWQVTTEWGKEHATQQRKDHQFNTIEAAELFERQMIDSKLKKGYRRTK